MPRVSGVVEGSLGERFGIKAGDEIISINGVQPRDVIDYQLLCDDAVLKILVGRNGSRATVKVTKEEPATLGLRFESSVFDGVKRCANRCVFCFIDQLPPGLRPSLYLKDDDYRLSFLYGNFITLTNLAPSDIARIKEQKLSPLYVSLHSVDEKLRYRLFGTKRAHIALRNMDDLVEGGIKLHIQVVLCPGLNDGKRLDQTLQRLMSYGEGIQSIGLVPVGVTRYRRDKEVRLFTEPEIERLVKQFAGWRSEFDSKRPETGVYLADEFYLSMGIELPPGEDYGDFPQLENGIGLARRFMDEVEESLRDLEGQIDVGASSQASARKVGLVTGELAEPILNPLSSRLGEALGLSLSIIPVKNEFFGRQVKVAGLLTGQDIARAINKGAFETVLTPDICLNGNGLFLDNVSVKQLEEATGARIHVVSSSGQDFVADLQSLLAGSVGQTWGN